MQPIHRRAALIGLGAAGAAPLLARPGVAQGAERDIRFAFGSPILSLDPGNSDGSQPQTVRYHVMEQLVRMNPATGAIEPLLAESWAVADDKVTWTFRLRPGVRFHDGTTLTSADVVASIRRMLDPANGLPRGNDLRAIRELREVDPLTVQIVTATPFGPFLAVMAQDSASVMSKASLERPAAAIAWGPVATGAYRYQSHVPQQSVTITRNDEYWGPRSGPRSITFLNVPEAATRLAMLETGQADIIVDVPAVELPRLRRAPQIGLIEKPNNRLVHIGINVARAPFNDVRVRRALLHAIDRDAIVEGVLGGLGEPAQSIIASVVAGYAPPPVTPYDPRRARALLAEAGFPNGFQTTIWTPQGRYFMDREVTVAVQAQLRAVGIRAEVQVMDWSSYLAVLRRPEAENRSALYLLGWQSNTNDIQHILDTVFTANRVPPAGWNTMFYRSEASDALSARVAAEVDEPSRKALAAEAQALIMGDAPWAPLYSSVMVTGHRADITGIDYMPTDSWRLHNVRPR
ncbi:ABC transporter substrate-binding protein [Humitalea sp. 24SJ18S-53]|uniref:ABC transporter substrate-binding protein n=1 Tax=Humitalea sp. 24SJ18S-53 TaxID=3422307 RepID=UPI003D67B1B3